MADSVLSQSLDAIVQAIKDLALTDIPSANIGRFVVLVDRNYDYPEIRVVPYGAEVISGEPQVQDRDDWTYPVVVGILDSITNITDGEKQFKWRQRIRKRFHNKSITIADVVKKTVCTPLAIVDREGWRDENVFLSALLIGVTTREDRDYTLP